MLIPITLAQLIFEKPKYRIKPTEQDIALVADYKPLKPLTTQLVEQDYIYEQSPVVGAVNTSGNTYYAGQCTAYAKDRRPDLPGNLGNANTWVYFASQQGLPTGTVPKVGAIAQLGMHVAYVESVNADGSFVISEQNYYGPFIIDTRVVSGAWQFIY